jgi:copper chaperone NosL
MSVSDGHFAAQIAAPGADPVFFDDIGCLRDYLKKNGVQIPEGATAFVADHRNGAWVRAAVAVFTRPTRLGTPMGGGLIAHADEESRRQDTDAADGARVSVLDIFGAAGPPAGKERR